MRQHWIFMTPTMERRRRLLRYINLRFARLEEHRRSGAIPDPALARQEERLVRAFSAIQRKLYAEAQAQVPGARIGRLPLISLVQEAR